MSITVKFKSLPAGRKSVQYGHGKPKYMCNGHRLPKFIWEKI